MIQKTIKQMLRRRTQYCTTYLCNVINPCALCSSQVCGQNCTELWTDNEINSFDFIHALSAEITGYFITDLVNFRMYH